MITLDISAGVVFTGIAVVGVAVYALYRIGKKQMGNDPSAVRMDTQVADKYIKNNPSTPKAKDAFLNNISMFMPCFSGVSNIIIDKDSLTDAIITVGDNDLISLWKQMINRPDLWLNQMAAWGVAPDARLEFVAMEKHKEQYSTKQGGELQNGVRYTVLSACWLQTTTNEAGASVKKVVKKGIVENKQ